MPSVLLLTSTYPYPPGEQFLEDEINYWCRSGFDPVWILPTSVEGTPRPLPDGVQVFLAPQRQGPARLVVSACRAVFSKALLRELGYLASRRELTPRRTWLAIRELMLVNLAEGRLRKVLAERHVDVVYSYWNNAACYAACRLKRKGWPIKVVSRAHGADLYEERRELSYMPLKWQYAGLADALFCLSPEAAAYFVRTYGAAKQTVSVAPLGVSLPATRARRSQPPAVQVVSLSFCVPVKRLDRILEAVQRLAATMPDRRVTWTHIGDGPLYESLKSEADLAARHQANLQCEFTGHLPHQEVKRFFADSPVDVFINSSASEGMPVSIMEAMSFGVPVIAPDVGSVAGLVSDERGRLLSAEPGPEEIAEAIRQCVLAPEKSRENMARSASEHIERHFNADVNYPRFIAAVERVLAR
ncbi:glycosyltransferase [Alloalcanivorax marinus]|uniref:glycosyltransferase n=1 Tax=Alloalcanivorax marinus TaxID=1177169 RepID=UPI0021CE13C8|nr:glycosyltransferase [Alloalcanivorax marinus]MCU5788073.1 polysaccharide biosynthesis protein [Alloalcanivorax marinus]